MTAAFNLAQLANNLNTAGQLDATDGLVGLVANSNLVSSGTADSTTYFRGDRTYQSLNSAIASALNATGSTPIYACRAWINFDGTTASPTIRNSGNVSSITDNGVGIYTVNFTTAMPTTNAAALVSVKVTSTGGYDPENNGFCEPNISAGNVQILTGRNPSPQDAYTVCLAIFR